MCFYHINTLIPSRSAPTSICIQLLVLSLIKATESKWNLCYSNTFGREPYQRPYPLKKLANPFPACAGLLYPAPPVHAAIVSDFILFRSYACSYNCCVFISGSIYQWNYPLEFRKHSFLKVIYHFWFLYNLSIPSLRMILEPWEKACYMCVPFGPECSAISYSLHFNQWWRNILFSEESCYWRALTRLQ